MLSTLFEIGALIGAVTMLSAALVPTRTERALRRPAYTR